MRTPLFLLIALSGAVLVATWVGYPVWLNIRARSFPRPTGRGLYARWPTVTIVVVVRNAEAALQPLLENLLALAYPPELRRILVVSNGSDDFTDAVARLYQHRGVRLLRVQRPRRTFAAAENFARQYVDSDLVVVVHPNARAKPSALTALVAPFADPTVGVAYGDEVSAAFDDQGARIRRSLCARFEGWLRDAESRVFGTVSARRSLYAVRGALYRAPVSDALSPDFAPILVARERGFRAVYAGDAEVFMTRERSLKRDYAQRVQTVARDAATLLGKRHLLNPRRYGAFAWILLGHKLGRWLSPCALLAGLTGLLLLAPGEPWARVALAAAAALGLDAAVAWRGPARTGLGRAAILPGHLAATGVATAYALAKALRSYPNLRLEPAPRPLFRQRAR